MGSAAKSFFSPLGALTGAAKDVLDITTGKTQREFEKAAAEQRAADQERQAQLERERMEREKQQEAERKRQEDEFKRDEEEKAKAEEQSQQRKTAKQRQGSKAAGSQGRRSTILTGSLGVSGEEDTARKRVLGV